jgi:SNF2 family DNA or RNA helicase
VCGERTPRSPRGLRGVAGALVITTYALATRDRNTLSAVKWERIALDEAQNIKTIDTKQTRAIRSLPGRHRVALTGTPVENRLTELHSIMDFLNPGLLGPAATFKRCYARPIERYRDEHATAQLRQLGPAPVEVEGRNLVELLAPAYATLAQAAERRALAE